MSTRLTLAIQEHFESLSPSERKLADLLLERADDLLAYSASEMAAMAGVSKATAARLFRSLGYADFNEVRLQARQERNLAPPFRRDAPRPAAGPARGRPTLASHLQLESEGLARTFEGLRGDLLRSAATTLARAPRLWLLGLGPDDGLVRYAWPQFARVRPDVHRLGSSGGLWAEEIANCAPKDALLVVQTQTRAALADKLLAQAAAARVATVALVDLRNAAWGRRVAGLVLPCHGPAGEQAHSSTTAASLLHLLAQQMAQVLGVRAQQRLAVVRDLRRELDDD